MQNKLKVLQVITSLSTGGAEKLLVDSLDVYIKNNIEVDVLTISSKETPFSQKIKNNSSTNLFCLTNKSVYNPLLIFKLIPYLKRYNIIHVHLFPALYWVALAKFFSFSTTKIIYTEHSTSNKRRTSTFFKFTDKIIYSIYNKIITIAEEVDLNLKKHLNSSSSENFQMIKNGIDTILFFNSNSYPKTDFFNESDKILIQVSSFRKEKDHETLIRAMVELPENVKLILVGDGYLKEYCINLVNSLNIGERVKFLGLRMDVPRLLKTSDIVILSSVHEGLSLSSIEGMAVGKPFIASNVPGLREVVQGVGLLFEKGNSKELANHIIELINDKNYYNEIAQKCYIHSQNYDINQMVNSYITVYRALT
ncbi:glycosyltransferase family protein [Emticicia fontis]